MFRDGDLVLGVDCSTQSLTINVYTAENFTLVDSVNVNFADTFPEFKTEHGIIRSESTVGEITSPSLMFVAALDRALMILRDSEKCSLARVIAVSGSGQQHGTVYWNHGGMDRFNDPDLDPSSTSLTDLCQSSFSFECGPIWMDSSTTQYCRHLEEQCGGSDKFASVTGGRLYERFGGVQIYKRMIEDPSKMRRTERVSLVSSLMASLFIGEYAPIDLSDACGLGLVDFRRMQWGNPLPCALFPSQSSSAAATVEDAESKSSSDSEIERSADWILGLLGGDSGLVESHSKVGYIHPFLQKRFGLNGECIVVAFSGDNPCSLAGMQLTQPGSVCVSLGTSSTVFSVLGEDDESASKIRPSAEEGWIFVSPLSPALVSMAVFKNGALLRDRYKNEVCGCKDWSEFESMLKCTPPGNGGNVGFFFDVSEITPSCESGTYRFNGEGTPVESFDSLEIELRAVIEFQFVSMRMHMESSFSSESKEPSTMKMSRFSEVLVTGGASQNGTLLQILSDVFGAPVLTADKSAVDAGAGATRGAALRALHGYVCDVKGHFVSFEEATEDRVKKQFIQQCEPDLENFKVYSLMCERMRDIEKTLPRLE